MAHIPSKKDRILLLDIIPTISKSCSLFLAKTDHLFTILANILVTCRILIINDEINRACIPVFPK